MKRIGFMKKYAFAVCLALPLLSGGCTPTTTIKTIGEVASGSLPVACQIYTVAEGYFGNVTAVNSASNINLGTLANTTAQAICANPATSAADITAALAKLNTLWVTIQAATTVPAVPPTPTASP